MSLTIAIDVMGGDYGPHVILGGASKAATSNPDIQFQLFGDRDIIDSYFAKARQEQRPVPTNITLIHCSEFIAATDKPAQVLRNKKDSSMRKSLEALADGSVDACVSAGNTGALFALAYYLVKTLNGIDRPALVSALPASDKHRVYVLDLGANVNSTADNLFQYAVMGNVLAQEIAHLAKPRVALLNVGAEDIKGNTQVKLADRMLKETSSINYIGYVEGGDLFTNKADIVVTDGFTGNVALKSTEGLAKLIMNEVKRQSQKSLLTRVMARISLPLLKRIYNKVNPDQYNGASLIGLRGTVVKSHGNASSEGFYYAIELAIQEATTRVPDKIKASIESAMLEQI